MFQKLHPPPHHITVDISEYPVALAEDVASEPDELFKGLRGFLIIGRVIGVLPFSGIFRGSSSNDLTFRRTSISSIFTHLILASLLFNTGLEVIGTARAPRRNALQVAESLRASVSNLWTSFIFLTFLYRGNKFIKIFTTWSKTHVTYSRKDKTLWRDALLISGIVLASAFLENSVLHLEYINSLDWFTGVTPDPKTSKMPWLECYYWRGNAQWAKLINYHWTFAVISFLQHKWILYSWNYIDICIAVFGRAMYFRFKTLCDVAEERLLMGQLDTVEIGDYNKRKNGMHYQDPGAWLQVVRDHESLSLLLEAMESFFSPLVFGSYAVNMFFISLQLLEGLTSEVGNHGIIHSIYAPWSFIHLVMRIYVISICCARINSYAHKARKLFEKCPVNCYTTKISRLDKRLTSGPDIGLTGLECFVVRTPFILTVIGVIFTVETVLLQCVPHNGMMTNAMVPATHS